MQNTLCHWLVRLVPQCLPFQKTLSKCNQRWWWLSLLVSWLWIWGTQRNINWTRKLLPRISAIRLCSLVNTFSVCVRFTLSLLLVLWCVCWLGLLLLLTSASAVLWRPLFSCCSVVLYSIICCLLCWCRFVSLCGPVVVSQFHTSFTFPQHISFAFYPATCALSLSLSLTLTLSHSLSLSLSSLSLSLFTFSFRLKQWFLDNLI